MRSLFVAIAIGGCVPQPAFVGTDPPQPGFVMVDLTGTGNGKVVSDPLGIVCPTACTAQFAPGTQVTLTLTPDIGSSLVGWSGACSGATCAVDSTDGAIVSAELACDPHDEVLAVAGGYPLEVPSCVRQMTFDVFGAQGGGAGTVAMGGRGGGVHATIDVTPGEMLHIVVGNAGAAANAGGAGGNNGGGRGTSTGTNDGGGGGGGASDVRRGGTTIDKRVIVAAGGAGALACVMAQAGIPGASGGADVGDMVQTTCATSGILANGGTQTSGGTGGTCVTPTMCNSASGILGIGGNSCDDGAGGGGGGGYYGGGGGAWAPGAGGSNLVPAGADNTSVRGVQSGNGSIRIQW